MAFDTMRNNLKLLEGNEPISIDALLESIMVLVEEAKDENESLSVQAFSLTDGDNYIVNLYRLLSFLSKEYLANSKATADMMVSYGKYIKEADTTIKELNSSIAKERDIVEDKRKKSEQLESERGHLLSLADENEELQKKIDKLSDPYLDSLDQVNKELQANLTKREEREEEIKKDNETLSDDINKIQKSIDTLELDGQRLNQEKEKKEATKSNLETSLEEIRSWIEDFDDWFEGIDKEVVKAEAQLSAMQTAWNSLNITDGALSVEYTSNNSEDDTTNSLNEIKNWFELKGKDIEDKLEEYRLRLKTVVETTESIMKSEN